ncbi:MAG: hypothetical protein BMS9Abin31_0134 [Gammaproteobacteria bacterium]|nr:MAG: hypothetical protein BMS9Abin31_0134 [Gammaproteobacteria bacterium]
MDKDYGYRQIERLREHSPADALEMEGMLNDLHMIKEIVNKKCTVLEFLKIKRITKKY